MTDLNVKFEKAAADVQKLKPEPTARAIPKPNGCPKTSAKKG